MVVPRARGRRTARVHGRSADCTSPRSASRLTPGLPRPADCAADGVSPARRAMTSATAPRTGSAEQSCGCRRRASVAELLVDREPNLGEALPVARQSGDQLRLLSARHAADRLTTLEAAQQRAVTHALVALTRA